MKDILCQIIVGLIKKTFYKNASIFFKTKPTF